MKLTHEELEFLSAWAREEWEPACYHLPAHRLQRAHGVSVALLIVFIKTWTESGESENDLEDSRRSAVNATAGLALVHDRGLRRSLGEKPAGDGRDP